MLKGFNMEHFVIVEVPMMFGAIGMAGLWGTQRAWPPCIFLNKLSIAPGREMIVCGCSLAIYLIRRLTRGI